MGVRPVVSLDDPRRPIQPLRALRRGNELRGLRSDLKQKMKSGEVDALDLLRGNAPLYEDIALGMRVDQALMAVPGVGEVTMFEVMGLFRLTPHPSLRLASLTYELRAQMAQVIAAALDGQPVRMPGPLAAEEQP